MLLVARLGEDLHETKAHGRYDDEFLPLVADVGSPDHNGRGCGKGKILMKAGITSSVSTSPHAIASNIASTFSLFNPRQDRITHHKGLIHTHERRIMIHDLRTDTHILAHDHARKPAKQALEEHRVGISISLV